MKKIITLLFCIGLFTASFSQAGGKRNRGNNAGNQATQPQDNRHYKNNGKSNQNSSGNNGTYNQAPQRSGGYDHGRGNAYGHEQANRYQRKNFRYRNERDRFEGRNGSFGNRRRHADERGYGHRRYPSFLVH